MSSAFAACQELPNLSNSWCVRQLVCTVPNSWQWHHLQLPEMCPRACVPRGHAARSCPRSSREHYFDPTPFPRAHPSVLFHEAASCLAVQHTSLTVFTLYPQFAPGLPVPKGHSQLKPAPGTRPSSHQQAAFSDRHSGRLKLGECRQASPCHTRRSSLQAMLLLAAKWAPALAAHALTPLA